MNMIKPAKNMKYPLAMMVMAFLLAIIVFPAGSGLAGNQKECWKKINGEIPPYEGYPAAFDGQGKIEVIRSQGFIINDIFRPVSPGTSYHCPGSVWGSKTMFSKGDYVAFLLDDEGRIKSLWLICKKR